MTDPKDAKPLWPTGLKKILEEHGVSSLRELMQKRIRPKLETKTRVALRLPYVDKADEPD